LELPLIFIFTHSDILKEKFEYNNNILDYIFPSEQMIVQTITFTTLLNKISSKFQLLNPSHEMKFFFINNMNKKEVAQTFKTIYSISKSLNKNLLIK
jgi:hypothetical protein